MAFLLPHSVFFHIPKTGGQWVASALRKAGLVCGEAGVVHASPDEVVGDTRVASRPYRFAFVRDPLTWYRSMWSHRMDEAWEPIDDTAWFTPRWIEIWEPFTDTVRADRFDRFVERVATVFPDGFVSRLYESYTEGCTHVGRTEQLADDLERILTDIGEVFDPAILRSPPQRNVRGRTAKRRAQAPRSPEVADLVRRVEWRAYQRYGFPQDPASKAEARA